MRVSSTPLTGAHYFTPVVHALRDFAPSDDE